VSGIRQAWADRGTKLLALALAVWALMPIVLIALHALEAHLRLTGADGLVGGDQLQYLAWARDAGNHGLAANLFDPAPSGHVFAQPMFTLSGALWRLGLPLPAAYLLWKPVAILVLFAGAAAWVSRFTPRAGTQRVAALALALFLFTPAAAIAAWAQLGSTGGRTGLLALAGEMFPAGALWGYLPNATAVGLVPVVLLAVERAQRSASRGRPLALAAAAAALACWLHPWQGVVLLLMLAGLGVWGRGRQTHTLLVPMLAAALPLVYYLLLSRLDPAWKLAAHNELVARLPAGAMAVGLLPLLALAAAGLRRAGPDAAERALVLWVPAALVTYLLVDSYPSHALESISLPLAILAVRGWGVLRLPVAVGAVAVAAATVPGAAYLARGFHRVAASPSQQYYLSAGDARALDWVAGGAPAGDVLARTIFAVAIPSQTGRAVWVGHEFWSRDYPARMRAADSLFAGKLSPPVARTFVLLARVRLLVSDCGSAIDLTAALGPLLASVHRFGCATVYVVRR